MSHSPLSIETDSIVIDIENPAIVKKNHTFSLKIVNCCGFFGTILIGICWGILIRSYWDPYHALYPQIQPVKTFVPTSVPTLLPTLVPSLKTDMIPKNLYPRCTFPDVKQAILNVSLGQPRILDCTLDSPTIVAASLSISCVEMSKLLVNSSNKGTSVSQNVGQCTLGTIVDYIALASSSQLYNPVNCKIDPITFAVATLISGCGL